MLRRAGWVVAAGVLAGLLVLAWGWHQWTGPGPAAPTPATAVRVRIPAGMTLAAAADTLVARGLLARRWSLLLGARLTGRERGLRAGLYELPFGRSPRELLDDLTSGRSVLVAVTLPEGLDVREMAALVSRAFAIPADRFLAAADSLARERVVADRLLPAVAVAAQDSLLAADGGHRLHWSEGLLAPDTYHFAEGSDAVTVASFLVRTQAERLALAWRSGRDGPNADLEPLELLTLASIVEAEARRDDERALIAAVYTNRLRQGWRLEADPTVAFVLDRKGKRLYYKHLKVDSPYNTYRRKGLPPAPIGAPGLASLAAAARPDPACDAMYFVSDGADGHVFSRTAREHEAAVQRFRAQRSRDRAAD